MKKLNIGIVAHADAGKTTLTEHILYLSEAIRTVGSVDEGTASTDSLPVEQRRGISVKAAGVSTVWKDTELCLIDAPGHSDFLSEVERSLGVLDAAVLVVSSVEGIQPQTRLLLKTFRRENLPCVVFLNKLDRAGSRYEDVLSQLEEMSGVPCLCFSQVFGEGEAACAVQERPLYEEELAERAVMACEEETLLERYLETGRVPEELEEQLRTAVAKARVIPVFCGASKFGVGVEALLDGLCRYLREAEPVQQELCARVFRVEHDTPMGKAAWVRLFAGSIESRQTILTVSGEEKVTGIRRIRGNKLEEAKCLLANETGVIYGLTSAKAGDLLGAPMTGLREFRLSEPLMLARAEPHSPEQLTALVSALGKLTEEDPALELEWNREKREAWVKIHGKMQLEILESVLGERWGLSVSFGTPSVIYRETPIQKAEGFEAYTMPKPCWAIVKLSVEPLPVGSGVQYRSQVSPDRLAYRYQNHIETSVRQTLQQGLSGWEVTDLLVTLLDGESHHVHTHPLDFFVATPMAVMYALQNAGTGLLEPILAAELSGPEKALGKTISLLVARRGEFDSPKMESGWFVLSARIPAEAAMDLPVEFAVLTSGEGRYEAMFFRYAPCPASMMARRERLGPDPLDRPRFILAARSALTEAGGTA